MVSEIWTKIPRLKKEDFFGLKLSKESYKWNGGAKKKIKEAINFITIATMKKFDKANIENLRLL